MRNSNSFAVITTAPGPVKTECVIVTRVASTFIPPMMYGLTPTKTAVIPSMSTFAAVPPLAQQMKMLEPFASKVPPLTVSMPGVLGVKTRA